MVFGWSGASERRDQPYILWSDFGVLLHYNFQIIV
jgi:hypothetical protein